MLTEVSINSTAHSVTLKRQQGVVREEPGRHAEGMAYVLQTNSFRKWNSRFELGMLKVMCFVVVS